MPTTSEEGVDRLKRKRITLRAATTKIINEIGVLLATDTTDIGELEETFDILLLKEAFLKELHKELEPSVEYVALEEKISGARGAVTPDVEERWRYYQQCRTLRLTLNDDEAVDATPPNSTSSKCRLSSSSPGVEHLLWTCVASAQQEVSRPSDLQPTSDKPSAGDRPRGFHRGPQTDAGNAAQIRSSGGARVPLLVTLASSLRHKS
ncbi:hypothetical protein HPB47_020693 [Ixodes persulcatus]|uniref:Uncharacterized protein n=1 Tax=Ixodes persulcatus TaxID=34615 RepID=A0AC60QH42_IXOPE|nr:hypothetical protein HPB47_020693 [Ixodes persulcatus]